MSAALFICIFASGSGHAGLLWILDSGRVWFGLSGMSNFFAVWGFSSVIPGRAEMLPILTLSW